MLRFSKITSCLLAIVLLVLAFTGCAGQGKDDGKIKILCSVFPEYDWVRSIVGDAESVEVSWLISNGQELHSYEASPADMVRIKESDIVISVGGVSDAWIGEAVEGTDAKHIKLSEIEGVTLYDVASHGGEHEHDDSHDHGHDGVDEHIWLSLKNAQVIVKYLAEEISSLDPNNDEKYNNNAIVYADKIKELDERMSNIASVSTTLLFADRFPFVYLFEDYGMDYYAAFEGCSSDISWTPETTIDLAARLDASEVKYLFVTETADGALARLVISTSSGGGQTATLNSMQSVSKSQAINTDYVTIMAENVATLERIFAK